MVAWDFALSVEALARKKKPSPREKDKKPLSSRERFIEKSTKAGFHRDPKKDMADVVNQVTGDLFHYFKFFVSETQLEYGSMVCEKICDKVEGCLGGKFKFGRVPTEQGKTSDREGFWLTYRDKVRKVIDAKRSAVSTEIKRAFASK